MRSIEQPRATVRATAPLLQNAGLAADAFGVSVAVGEFGRS